MQESSNSPAVRFVTARTITSEQFAMRIAIAVAADAVKLRLFGRSRNRQSEKALEIIHHLARYIRMSLLPDREMGADPEKDCMIHLDRAGRAEVLDVAAAAILDGRMECGWLFPEIDCGGAMAANARD
ncbi:hypothetical protein ES707_05818 [subsurface metagenome]